MAHLFWKQCLLVTNIAALLVGVGVALHSDNACYFWFYKPECSQHRLQCGRGNVFLTQAVRGFKPEDDPCPVGLSPCINEATCCRNNPGQDCLETYSLQAFSGLAQNCWNRQWCNHTVQPATRISCKWPYTQSSGYSEVQYVCLDDSAIHNFNDNRTMLASSLALRYVSSHGSGYYVCRVTVEDCTNSTSSVLLTKWPNTINNYCSSLRVTGDDWLSCSESVSYKTYTLSTPFDVELYVASNEYIAQAWAVINADDSRNLRIECKRWSSAVFFQKCIRPTTAPSTLRSTTLSPRTPGTTPAGVLSSTTAPTMAPPSPHPTSQITGSAARPSSGKTGTSDNTAAGVQSSATSSFASGPTSAVTERTMALSTENTGNTAAVVGGVVGVVVLLVVVAVVVAIVIVRRRHPTYSPFAKTVAWFRGGNSSRSDGNSRRAAQHVTYAQPTALPVYDNSAVTISDEAGVRDPDSDYNHLGQKPTSSASRDVTYGHLADGSDVTDYGYDHVAKGKPAARSGDVINNVYNTPGPAACGPSEEDFYHTSGAAKIRPDVINNVYNTAGPATGGSSDDDEFYHTTGSAKNRPDVINNVYNTPGPTSEASSDVEYYNTAGIPQSGRDVTNTVYDTPKSARTAGPGDTEAHDVTGADTDSPYELARNVK